MSSIHDEGNLNSITQPVPFNPDIRRYCPNRDFPPYRYVPRLTSHPVKDPDGHSYRATSEDIVSPVYVALFLVVSDHGLPDGLPTATELRGHHVRKGEFTMSVNEQNLMKAATRYYVSDHFHGMYEEERNEAMWGFLLAGKAESEGHPEVAGIIREVAQDELKHAIWMGMIAQKHRLEGNNLADQIEGAMSADDAVVEREREIAQMARLLGREEDAATFDQMAKDELDHVEKYKQALELLQKKVPD